MTHSSNCKKSSGLFDESRLSCRPSDQANRVGCKSICIGVYSQTVHTTVAIYLAHSANLAEGLYILSMFFSLCFYIFNGRLSNTCFSESNGPIFTKISGLVDGWKSLLTTFSFLRSIKVRCHGNQLKSQNQRFLQTNHLCRAVIRKRIAILQFRFQRLW